MVLARWHKLQVANMRKGACEAKVSFHWTSLTRLVINLGKPQKQAQTFYMSCALSQERWRRPLGSIQVTIQLLIGAGNASMRVVCTHCYRH